MKPPLSSAHQWLLVEGKDRATLQPLGVSIPKARMAQHLRKKAFYVVRDWEEKNNLAACMRPNDPALWWCTLRNRFTLYLADVLFIVESLRELHLEGQPEQIVIDASSSFSIYGDALQVCFPRVKILVKKQPESRIKIRLFRWVRSWRAMMGAARLKKLPGRGSVRRVLLFSTEIHWLGRRDKDMCSIERALRARGIEVVTVATRSNKLGKDLAGLLTRPWDHIFSDFIGQPVLGRPGSLPSIPSQFFVHEGLDFSLLVRRWRQQTLRWDIARVDQRWTEVIKEIAPDAILMAQGHTEMGAPFRAAASAGIKKYLIQHGRITPYHPLYSFPRCAEGVHLLPDKFFVYSRPDADTLKEHSIFKSDTIAVTGSPEWDPILERVARDRARSDHGAVNPAGQPLRWLFTSQKDLDEGIMALLIQGAATRKPADILRIRLHPREDSASTWRRILAQYRFKAELTKKTPLEDDLIGCNVHLTFTSTCVMHAVIAERPTILLGEVDDPWRDQFIIAGVGRKAVTLEELVGAVAFWSTPAGQSEFMTKRKLFLDKLGIEPIPSGQKIARMLYPELEATPAQRG